MDAKEFFNSIANLASAFSGPDAPAPRQARGAQKARAKPLHFGGGPASGGGSPPTAPAPSCCIAKRAQQVAPVGPGKLSPVRKP